ncbi:MAG: hypothetical protein WCL44_01485 [bacterium]
MEDQDKTKVRHGAVRWLEGFLVLSTAILLVTPMFAKVFHMPVDVVVHGSEARLEMPALTWSAWQNGTYQQRIDEYLAQQTGLRGFLVKLYNQTQYSLFGVLAKGHGTRICKGRGGWLYEEDYVKHYMKAPKVSDQTIDHFVKHLAALQQLFSERGATFVVLVSPSKPEIYPEHLPSGVRRFDAVQPGVNAYGAFIEALKREGIRYYDAHAKFLEWKQAGPPLFAPGGTHWNYYGVQLVANDLLRILHGNAGLTLPVLPEVTGANWLEPLGTDIDLRSLLNLWHFKGDGRVKAPYPVMTRHSSEGGAKRIKVVVVGDSFSFTLVDAMTRTDAVDQIELLYYFKRRFRYDMRESGVPPGYSLDHAGFEVGPFTPENLDWNEVFRDVGLVILELNEIMPKAEGWGFPKAAKNRLRELNQGRSG